MIFVGFDCVVHYPNLFVACSRTPLRRRGWSRRLVHCIVLRSTALLEVRICFCSSSVFVVRLISGSCAVWPNVAFKDHLGPPLEMVEAVAASAAAEVSPCGAAAAAAAAAAAPWSIWIINEIYSENLQLF
jgi:hypothetical protein